MINKEQEWNSIKNNLFTDGWAIVDNFFEKKFALHLRKKILNNYKDAKANNVYSDYILKDADENIFPSLEIANDLYKYIDELKNTYKRSWVGVYKNKGKGTSYHYDWESLITVNIWLTPNECVDDFNKNGLVILPIQVSEDIKQEHLMAKEPTVAHDKFVKHFINLHKHLKPITINYNFNRAVFHTNLLHATNDVSMKEGENNKRVSITILFR